MAYTTIDNPELYFNTKIWTGNATERQISLDFQPDWVWIKNRTQTFQHILTDSVRGATKELFSSNNNPESTNAQDVKSFDSDGFTIGTDGNVNSNSQPIVGWSWKAGNSSGSSNSDGSITSTVSVSTDAGFSIVKYTGTGSNATVGHGLGAVPKMFITKRYDSASENWTMYHVGRGNTKYLFLNKTNAEGTDSSYWNNTTPTSSVFSISTNDNVNTSSGVYICYCFAEKKGYSSFGTYTGNGASSPNEPFVYLGFKPAIIFYKRASDGTNNWSVFDNKRDPHNEIEKQLNPNISNAEGTSSRGDFLSNGWKVGGGNSGSVNNSGSTYIYWAFAESPFVNSNGVPTNAR